jgi:hypothetical protein
MKHIAYGLVIASLITLAAWQHKVLADADYVHRLNVATIEMLMPIARSCVESHEQGI